MLAARFRSCRGYGHTITIDQLLTQRSGLREWNTLGYLEGWGPYNDRRSYTQAEAVELIARQRHLNFVPGTQFMYSNSNYVLLATIVERASGKSLRSFLREQFFGPLGMRNTDLRDDHRRLIPNRSYAYRTADGQLMRFMPNNDVHGLGGLLTTPHDLLIWTNAIDTGKLGTFISTELEREAVGPDGKPSGYARGLWIGKYKGLREISHGGSTAGYETTQLLYPERHVAVALQCNALEANTNKLAHAIADALLGLAPEPVIAPAKATPIGASQLRKYVGRFISSADGSVIEVAVKDGSLMIRDRPAKAIGPKKFLVGGQVLVTFRDLDSADVDLGGGKTLVIRRAPGAGMPELARLKSFEGTYRSDEIDARYRASVKDGAVMLELLGGPDFKLKLQPTGADTFENDGDVYRFVHDKRGQVTGLSITAAGVNELVLTRKQ